MAKSRSSVVSSFTIIKGSLIDETHGGWDFDKSRTENSAAFARTTPSAPPAPTGHATSQRPSTGDLPRQAATGRLSSSPSPAATETCGSPSCSFT